MPSKEAEEETELRMYERHQRYFAEAKTMGITEWCNLHRQPAPFEKQRDINLFIARYSSDLEVIGYIDIFRFIYFAKTIISIVIK